MKLTCISQELEGPNELKDVEYSKDSRIWEVPEVSVWDSSWRVGKVLEHEESYKSSKEEDEQGNIGIDSIPVKEEPLGVVKENALKFDFVWVEKEHAQTKDC